MYNPKGTTWEDLGKQCSWIGVLSLALPLGVHALSIRAQGYPIRPPETQIRDHTLDVAGIGFRVWDGRCNDSWRLPPGPGLLSSRRSPANGSSPKLFLRFTFWGLGLVAGLQFRVGFRVEGFFHNVVSQSWRITWSMKWKLGLCSGCHMGIYGSFHKYGGPKTDSNVLHLQEI